MFLGNCFCPFVGCIIANIQPLCQGLFHCKSSALIKAQHGTKRLFFALNKCDTNTYRGSLFSCSGSLRLQMYSYLDIGHHCTFNVNKYRPSFGSTANFQYLPRELCNCWCCYTTAVLCNSTVPQHRSHYLFPPPQCSVKIKSCLKVLIIPDT